MTRKRSDQVMKIVFTGGPGGGKSTALGRVREWLEGLGYVVGVITERATDLILAGLSPARDWGDDIAFQTLNLREQLALENIRAQALEEVRSDRPRILLCDRGALDGFAYIPPTAFREILHRVGREFGNLRSRYDGVIHLVTAAMGFEEAYLAGLAENEARTETPEKARRRDEETRQAWLGVSRFQFILPEKEFEEKLVKVKAAVAHFVGIPEPVEMERRFVVGSAPDQLPVPSVISDITQVYLVQTREGVERRVRSRRCEGHTAYYYTEKANVPGSAPGTRYEREERLTSREYRRLLSEADRNLRVIRKTREVFIWENLYFELDRFMMPQSRLMILEVELTSASPVLRLPPFLTGVREVTGDKRFNNFSIASDELTN